MITSANIVSYDGYNLIVRPHERIGRELAQKQVHEIELRIVDGRTISAEQRRKIYAIIRDIAFWCGDNPEWIKEYFKFNFCGEFGIEYFSLSDCEKSVARDFISYLRDTLLNVTDDIGRYLYSCLENRKCAICNAPGEVHHVDRIGMGRDREQIVHIGLKAICLCRKHHDEAHRHEKELFDKYKIYGIELDEYLCTKLKLNTKRKR